MLYVKDLPTIEGLYGWRLNNLSMDCLVSLVPHPEDGELCIKEYTGHYNKVSLIGGEWYGPLVHVNTIQKQVKSIPSTSIICVPVHHAQEIKEDVIINNTKAEEKIISDVNNDILDQLRTHFEYNSMLKVYQKP